LKDRHTPQCVVLDLQGQRAISGGGRAGVGSEYDLRLWDLRERCCLRKIESHQEGVTAIVTTADGRFAISGAYDKTVRVFDLTTGRMERLLEGHNDIVSSVSLSKDGHWALSSSWDKTLILWELDWELEPHEVTDWDEGARSHLQTFLTLHTPYAGSLPEGREPSDEEVTIALTRRGKPSWIEEDSQGLIRQLQYAGYGWLRPEGSRGAGAHGT
jgi:WD40 repeat protein